MAESLAMGTENSGNRYGCERCSRGSAIGPCFDITGHPARLLFGGVSRHDCGLCGQEVRVSDADDDFAVIVVNEPRAIIVALRGGHFLALQVSLRERGSLLRSATAIATRAFMAKAVSSKRMTNLTIVVFEKGDGCRSACKSQGE